MTASRTVIVLGVVVVLACGACTGDSANRLTGLTCEGGGGAHVSVDYADSTGDPTPLAAVAIFLTGAGQGLPTNGYVVDDTFHGRLTAGETAPSSEPDPSGGSTIPSRTTTVVHRSDRGVDVAATLTDYGAGWQVTTVDYCSEAKRS